MTPESGTDPVTTVNGDLVVKCRTPTAVKRGTARSNVFSQSSHFVDDGAMKISIPDTSSDEGMVTEDETDDNIRSPQRQSDGEDDDDGLIPSTPAPSSSRRRKCIEKQSKKISGKNLEMLFTDNSILERPRDNKNEEGDSVSEEGDIVGTIPQPSYDASMVVGDPGNG